MNRCLSGWNWCCGPWYSATKFTTQEKEEKKLIGKINWSEIYTKMTRPITKTINLILLHRIFQIRAVFPNFSKNPIKKNMGIKVEFLTSKSSIILKSASDQ